MNAAKVSAFADYVRRQAAGDPSAASAIRALAVTTDDGYCLSNLVGEWESTLVAVAAPGILAGLNAEMQNPAELR